MRGPAVTLGLLAVATAVPLLAWYLRGEINAVPLQLAEAVCRLERSADYEGYRRDLAALFAAHPEFGQVFGRILPVPTLTAEPPAPQPQQVLLLEPVGVVAAGEGPLRVRLWLEAEAPRGLWLTVTEALDPAAAFADLRPDPARTSGPYSFQQLARLPDGSAECELPLRVDAGSWHQLAVGSTEHESTGPVLVEVWFRTEPVRRPETGLLKLCRQGRLSPSQADLLLAMHLQDRGELLAAAALLELLVAERRSSPAADRLAASVHRALGRGPAHPRESPVRPAVAVW